MKAFISWSGDRGLLIAKAIREWLRNVVPEIESFYSPDMPKGRAWFDVLAKELRGASVGFMCLASARGASDWQLVEAGAIWKATKWGGLFPLCFDISSSDVPKPLQAFQLTYFNKEDFMRLAKDVVTLVSPNSDWTPEREQAFRRGWPRLKASVEDALRRPDDNVHTTPGFIHEVAGGWWERVRHDGGGSMLSWVWFQPSTDGTSQTITGRGFGVGGEETARWQTDLVSIQAQLPKPMLEYYWEGNHPDEKRVRFGGKGWFQFTISPNGSITKGTGEFDDVCMEEARTPTTKWVDIRKATEEEILIMGGNDENERRALVTRTLQAWP